MAPTVSQFYRGKYPFLPYVEVRSYIRGVHATKVGDFYSYKENQITVRTSLQWLCANRRKVKGHTNLVISLACSQHSLNTKGTLDIVVVYNIK